MKYFVTERKPTEKNMRNAANKARSDVETILEISGQEKVNITIPFKGKQPIFKSIKENVDNYKIWKNSLSHLKRGDELVVQFPLLSKNIFISHLFKKLKNRGIKIVVLLHDLESLRYLNDKLTMKHKMRLQIEENSILNQADKVIAHNHRMKDYLLRKGLKESQLINLELFDYLHESNFKITPKQLSNNIIIAGNLDPAKVGYLRSIGDIKGVMFQLFGANYDSKNTAQNVKYNGSFLPEDLPSHLKGSFGLVWDGNSIDTCSGVYGDYLRFNNPHKTSLYLSTGFPVIMWDKAALADFVSEHNVGITVSSLSDISRKLEKLTDEDYLLMLKNVAEISSKLRRGYFLEMAISNV